MFSLRFFSFLLLCILNVEGAKILVLAPFYGTSHAIVIQSVGLHLASQGHELTVVTYHMVKDPPKNYKQIKVDKHPFKDLIVDHFKFANDTVFDQIALYLTNYDMFRKTLNTPELKNFIANDDTKFDLIISEVFFQEPMYMFAYKYKAPLILIGTTTTFFHVADFMGNPMPLNIVYHDQSRGPMNSLKNMMICVYERLFRKYWYLPRVNKLTEEYFGNLPGPLPLIEELEKNVSLVFFNTHYSYDQVAPLIPGIVEIGGVHIKPSNPLDKELQEFLDGAKNGAIVFAMGSHIESSKLAKDKLDSFLKVFTTIDQRVLWKWENDDPPITANNILFKRWIPQFDVLGHPNVKIFINHCGMLSVQEAVHNGVPIIGIPLFADQYRNIRRLVDQNAGVELNFLDINEMTVRTSINKILNNDIYATSMKSMSEKFKNRQNNPLDSVSYWVNYVIKHKDPKTLKTPLATMAFYEYYAVEIIAFLVLTLFLMILYGIIIIISKIAKLCKPKKIKQN